MVVHISEGKESHELSGNDSVVTHLLTEEAERIANEHVGEVLLDPIMLKLAIAEIGRNTLHGEGSTVTLEPQPDGSLDIVGRDHEGYDQLGYTNSSWHKEHKGEEILTAIAERCNGFYLHEVLEGGLHIATLHVPAVEETMAKGQ